VRVLEVGDEIVSPTPRSDAPDMHTQFESLLDQVWRSEAEWRLWDRLDAADAQEAIRRKRRFKRPSQEAA